MPANCCEPASLFEKGAKRGGSGVAERGLVRKLCKQVFTSSRSGVFGVIVPANENVFNSFAVLNADARRHGVLQRLAGAAVGCVNAPRFERWFLRHEIASGIEHEANADVKATGAVSVRRLVTAAVFGAKHRVEQDEGGLLCRTVLAFRPFVMRALS